MPGGRSPDSGGAETPGSEPVAGAGRPAADAGRGADGSLRLSRILACPRCRGGLRRHADGFSCRACGHLYPLRFGIPDFRLEDDPFIGREAEARKVERILEADDTSFRGLVRRYYELSPENPPELHRHYVRAMENASPRGRAHLRRLRRRYPDLGRGLLLDIGCGTAGMTAAAAPGYETALGIDVALRWLVLGRHRLREQGVEATLLCANAEHLPLRPGIADAVVADSVVEHVREPRRMRNEIERVLRPGGAFFCTTNNRYGLLPEPHVRLWGFGFLPRRWMKPLALWLRGTPYEARLRSRRELRSIFGSLGKVELPHFDEEQLRLPPTAPKRWWERIRRLPLVPRLVGPFVPHYFVFGRKPDPREDDGETTNGTDEAGTVGSA